MCIWPWPLTYFENLWYLSTSTNHGTDNNQEGNNQNSKCVLNSTQPLVNSQEVKTCQIERNTMCMAVYYLGYKWFCSLCRTVQPLLKVMRKMHHFMQTCTYGPGRCSFLGWVMFLTPSKAATNPGLIVTVQFLYFRKRCILKITSLRYRSFVSYRTHFFHIFS